MDPHHHRSTIVIGCRRPYVQGQTIVAHHLGTVLRGVVVGNMRAGGRKVDRLARFGPGFGRNRRPESQSPYRGRCERDTEEGLHVVTAAPQERPAGRLDQNEIR
jgi:hypothetical protein